MTAVPETKYAKSGDLHIAYQAIGAGPFDLVFMHGWISHIEHMWEEPRIVRFLDRLASFARLIVLDKRGTGLSDPVSLDRLPTLERADGRPSRRDGRDWIRAGRPDGNFGGWGAELVVRGDVRLGSIKRVASAVGEGAMAVQFVHEYLRMNDGTTS